MRTALVVTGGVDSSAREKVIPSLLSLIERLARQHELHVFALRYLSAATTYPLLGATVHDLGSPRGIARQYRALRSAMARVGRFDIIHGYWALPAGLVSVLVGRRLGVPSVVTFDSGEFVGIPDIHYGAQLSWRQRLAVRATARLATRSLVCTRYQQSLGQELGVTAAVVPLGADPRWLSPPERRIEGPPWRLLHVGSINPVKDHNTLLRAFEILIARGVDASLDIVGEDTMQGAAQRLAARLGLQSRVTFHGARQHDQLQAFYRRAHLFVLSSRHEAAGMVVLEAALCGLPVVGSAVGYIADWAPERAAGVRPHDPEALASAIAALLANQERRQTMADAAFAWAGQHDADRTAGELLQVYSAL